MQLAFIYILFQSVFYVDWEPHFSPVFVVVLREGIRHRCELFKALADYLTFIFHLTIWATEDPRDHIKYYAYHKYKMHDYDGSVIFASQQKGLCFVPVYYIVLLLLAVVRVFE